jgi:hypothetical protein
VQGYFRGSNLVASHLFRGLRPWRHPRALFNRGRRAKEFIMSKEQDNKAIVGRWFTEFWGKSWNPEIVEELGGLLVDLNAAIGHQSGRRSSERDKQEGSHKDEGGDKEPDIAPGFVGKTGITSEREEHQPCSRNGCQQVRNCREYGDAIPDEDERPSPGDEPADCSARNAEGVADLRAPSPPTLDMLTPEQLDSEGGFELRAASTEHRRR